MSAPNITPQVVTNNSCTTLLFTDATVYTGSAITSSQVTQAIININYATTSSTVIYTFTIISNVITACAVSVNGATAVDIYSQLSSTVFPLTSFDLAATYTNVTIPTINDGVYDITYTVNGSGFSYTGTIETLVNCSTCCCISKMFQKIDPNCGCSEKSWLNAMRAYSYLLAANFSADVGNSDNAVAALNKANDICSNGCGCN